MTLYAGEVAQVRHAAWDLDTDERLTSTDVDSITVTIWDTDGETILIDQLPMQWNAAMVLDDDDDGVGCWFANWVTPDDAPGGYDSRIELIAGGLPSWEYKKIRTRANRRALP